MKVFCWSSVVVSGGSSPRILANSARSHIRALEGWNASSCSLLGRRVSGISSGKSARANQLFRCGTRISPVAKCRANCLPMALTTLALHVVGDRAQHQVHVAPAARQRRVGGVDPQGGAPVAALAAGLVPDLLQVLQLPAR